MAKHASNSQDGLYLRIGCEFSSILFTAFLVIRLTRQQTQLFLNPPVIDEPAPWKPGVPPMRVRPSLPRRPNQPDSIKDM